MKSRNLFVKIATFILFGLLILSFAVWGIGDMFRTGGHAQQVAKVGDTVIDQRSFSRELSQEITTMSRQFGVRLTIDQIRALGIPQQVINRLISQAILDEMSARLGLLITEEQMRAQIFENPAFLDATGRFDRNRFAQALQFSGLSEEGYLAILSTDTQRRQVTEAVTEGAVAPRSLARQLFAYREERRVADYLTISNDSVGALGEPDEAAVRETFEAATGTFMTPAFKDIALVHLSIADAAADIAVSEEALAAEFEARRAELSKPERRAVTQAVLPDQAAAQALADKIAGGADFEAATREATGRGPVSLGILEETELFPEMAGPVFELEVGKASGPLQSPVGWHVVVVTAIEEAEEADLETLRAQLIEEIAQAQAIDIVIDQANRFDEAIAGGLAIEEAARGLGFDSRQIAAIDDRGLDPTGTAVEGLPAGSEFLEVLRETAVGDTSLLTETLDGDYFILRVDGETPAAPRPLEEVRKEVVELWRAGERRRLAQERAEALKEKLDGGTTLTALAESEGLSAEKTEPVTRFDGNPERTPSALLSQRLFDIAKGETVLVSTPDSQIVARLIDIQGADSSAAGDRLDAISDELAGAMRNDIFQQFLASLQAEFDVTINQPLIDQTLLGSGY